MLAGSSWLLPVIFISIGALVGALLATLFSGSSPQPEENPGQENETGQSPPGRPAGLEEGAYKEVVRLWRDEESGKLVTEMHGIAYAAVDEMPPEMRESVQNAARQWLAWTGQNIPSQSVSPQAANAVPDLEALKVNLPRKSTLPPALENEQEKPPEAPKESMVVQIDNILQEMLAGSALEERGIHLAEGANMSVIVWVGNEHYQGIDQVADPAIAHVIRKAVSEWEQRSVPNLR